MTIVIYLTEDKKNYHVIHPKTDGKNSKDNFDGNVRKLVEHITHSDYENGFRNYHSFIVI